ncbi:hypothetical protein P4O66_020150 [Electrophorus voltai]|uniref:Uncharacterized protein n=1 Tax=Electrophorus voltai TaxID=2609070 RepID=A0AAD8ZVD7_9TELE|nr:hypothetical protein P4O66_020150 [Electrophorus voltai]
MARISAVHAVKEREGASFPSAIETKLGDALYRVAEWMAGEGHEAAGKGSTARDSGDPRFEQRSSASHVTV